METIDGDEGLPVEGHGGVRITAEASLTADGELGLRTVCMVRADGAIEVHARLLGGEEVAAIRAAGGKNGGEGGGGVGFCSESTLCLRSVEKCSNAIAS